MLPLDIELVGQQESYLYRSEDHPSKNGQAAVPCRDRRNFEMAPQN